MREIKLAFTIQTAVIRFIYTIVSTLIAAARKRTARTERNLEAYSAGYQFGLRTSQRTTAPTAQQLRFWATDRESFTRGTQDAFAFLNVSHG